MIRLHGVFGFEPFALFRKDEPHFPVLSLLLWITTGVSLNKKKLGTAGLISLIALLLNFQLVLGHEAVTVGDYQIEYGWLDEPAIVGQQNAIVVNVLNTSSGEEQPVKDISSLTVTVSYGGRNKTLTLQPLSEDTPGQFVAPILPTVAGTYTLIFGGKLGDTDVKTEVEPEEVEGADTLQFPSLPSDQQSADLGRMNWLVYLSLLIGLVAPGLGVAALRKAR